MNYIQKAKLQFIKNVDRLCEARKCSWTVFGNFVHHIVLGGNDEQISKRPLEICLSNRLTNNRALNAPMLDVINDLYVMKFITHWNTQDNHTVYCKVSILIDMIKVDFKCIFYNEYFNVFYDSNYNNLTMFASQQIVLRHNGISLHTYGGGDGDENEMYGSNANRGISLAQRLIQLQAKNDLLLMPYVNANDSDSYYVRFKNAMIMKKQLERIQDGFTVTGKQMLSIQDNDSYTCPICFEKQSHITTLQCSHKFCIKCLAKHIEMIGDSHSKCPLCRQPVLLSLIDC